MPDQESTHPQTPPQGNVPADVHRQDVPIHERTTAATASPVAGPPNPAQPPAADPAAAAATPADTFVAYEPVADEATEWDEPIEDLPPRPRRRLLGAGANPLALTLLGVLLIACGFIGGVLVEKDQTSSSASGTGAAGLASRFAALRGASSATGASSGAGGFGGASGFGGGAGAGVTTGNVAYIAGDTLYVTSAEGNTVRVTTSAASTVTKTVKSEVKDIHPGETVVVSGAAGANGAIAAESIRVGGAGGGLGALFGGSGAGGRAGAGGGNAAGGSGSAGGGEPALFGKGG